MTSFPEVEPIASHMGKKLLTEMDLDLAALTHATFGKINGYLEKRAERLFSQAIKAARKEFKDEWLFTPKLALTG